NGSGYSVSMPDNNTVAIGATLYGSSAGQVRVFFWNETAWAQKGTQIIGEAAEDQFGGALSMPDSNTVAVGARKNDGNGSNSGHVRIYCRNGSDWAQKGSNLVGEDYGDEFGTSVSMPDSNIVAIGAPKNTGSAASSGHVRIFQWIDTAWVQKGADIDGEETSDESGRAVSMPNANTVAIGATLNNGAVFNAGHVRVFVWNGSAWVQRGTDIEGDYEDGMFGVAVSMPDSNTVGVGANADLGNNNINAGKTRVYSFLSIVGIAENTFGANLSAYPNPTTGQLTINLGSEYRDLVITQSNEMGQTVNSTQHIAQEQKLQYQLVGEPGIYFIEVSTPGKRAVITVIKKQ
ncbi:MAG TPA: T9SS type A sorting domain-containing protein, partial [Chitinophagales bacterium]|nr:T9SS type A sorting domain-containing protein [Chitinophagales bacterium]